MILFPNGHQVKKSALEWYAKSIDCIVLLGCVYNSVAEFICILIESDIYTLDFVIEDKMHGLVIR